MFKRLQAPSSFVAFCRYIGIVQRRLELAKTTPTPTTMMTTPLRCIIAQHGASVRLLSQLMRFPSQCFGLCRSNPIWHRREKSSSFSSPLAPTPLQCTQTNSILDSTLQTKLSSIQFSSIQLNSTRSFSFLFASIHQASSLTIHSLERTE